MPAPLSLPAEVVEIASRLEEAGFEAWCVGGAIRDALLGLGRDDVDLATSARPEEVQRLFRRTVPVGLKFGTVGVLDRRGQLHEVTTFRRDVVTDGRHAVVEYGASLDQDLARRDFTINAVAYHPIRQEWRDPFGGENDLGARLVRAVGEPGARFREDYLRILRAVRFATRFDFAIDHPTWAAALAESAGLAMLSAERVREEWFRSLLTARSVGRLVRLWREVGAAERWLPELATDYPFATDPPADRDPVLLTAVLSSDPAVSLERLKASTLEIERGRRIGQGPAAPPSDDPVAVRRWLRTVGPAADDLRRRTELLTGADPTWGPVVDRIRAKGEAVSRTQLAVTGDDIKALGVAPGPAIGRILEQLLELVIEDPGSNRREVLLERVRTLG
jgi:tRNA nucleotidyltransferase (CCA-adding enzyme)